MQQHAIDSGKVTTVMHQRGRQVTKQPEEFFYRGVGMQEHMLPDEIRYT